jgi:hypothetical protein
MAARHRRSIAPPDFVSPAPKGLSARAAARPKKTRTAMRVFAFNSEVALSKQHRHKSPKWVRKLLRRLAASERKRRP